MDLASWQLIRFDCKKKQRKKSNKRDGKVVELSSVFRSSNVLSLQTYIRRREDEEEKNGFHARRKLTAKIQNQNYILQVNPKNNENISNYTAENLFSHLTKSCNCLIH